MMTDEQLKLLHGFGNIEQAFREAYRLGWEARGKRDAEVCRTKAQEARDEADLSSSPSESLELTAMAAGAESCAHAIERDGKD